MGKRGFYPNRPSLILYVAAVGDGNSILTYSQRYDEHLHHLQKLFYAPFFGKQYLFYGVVELFIFLQ